MDKIRATMIEANERLAEALAGLSDVTWTLIVTARQSSHHKAGVKIYTRVEIWFHHSFKKALTGDDDIEWLAKACRELAEETLAKMAHAFSKD